MLSLVKNIAFKKQELGEKGWQKASLAYRLFESLTAALIAEIGKQLPRVW